MLPASHPARRRGRSGSVAGNTGPVSRGAAGPGSGNAHLVRKFILWLVAALRREFREFRLQYFARIENGRALSAADPALARGELLLGDAKGSAAAWAGGDHRDNTLRIPDRQTQPSSRAGTSNSNHCA